MLDPATEIWLINADSRDLAYVFCYIYGNEDGRRLVDLALRSWKQYGVQLEVPIPDQGWGNGE